MKLKDIAGKQLKTRLNNDRFSFSNHENLKKDIFMWPEIEELQRADASGLVDSCVHLQDDERELADTILNKLRDSSYLPSPIVYQVIRAINARILISLELNEPTRLQRRR